MSFTDRLLLWLHIGFAIFTLGPVVAAMMATPRYIRKRDLAVLRYLYRTTRIFGVLTGGVFLFGLLLGRHDFSQAWFSAAMTLFIVAAVLLVLVIFDQRRAITAIDKAVAVDEARAQTPVPANGVVLADQRESQSAGHGAAVGTAGAATAAAVSGEESVTARADQPAKAERATAEDGLAGEPAGVGGSPRPAGAGASPQPAAAGASRQAAAARTGGATGPASGAAGAIAGGAAGRAAGAAHLASVERGRIVTMGGVITAIWLVILVLMVWHG